MNKKELKAVRVFIKKRIGNKGNVKMEELDEETVNTLTEIREKYSNEQIGMEFRKVRLEIKKQIKQIKEAL